MNQKMNNQEENSSLGRRDFIKKSVAVAGIAATGGRIAPDFDSEAETPAMQEEGLEAGRITYPGATGDMKAYQARPVKGGKFPAVIVIHENRGLNPHIEDVTRRMAKEGFLALAPDALSPVGGTPEDSEKARSMFSELNREATVKNFVAAVQYLKTNPASTGKVGCTGFCWGGAMTNQVAVNSPDLLAAVPYYGGQPDPADVPKIKAAMMLHYGANDDRINAGIPAFEEALRKAKIEFTTYMYQGAGHAFNNDTSPERYNKEAAELAWKRTVTFFKEKLK